MSPSSCRVVCGECCVRLDLVVGGSVLVDGDMGGSVLLLLEAREERSLISVPAADSCVLVFVVAVVAVADDRLLLLLLLLLVVGCCDGVSTPALGVAVLAADEALVLAHIMYIFVLYLGPRRLTCLHILDPDSLSNCRTIPWL